MGLYNIVYALFHINLKQSKINIAKGSKHHIQARYLMLNFT